MDYEYYDSLTEEQQEIADRIHEFSYEEGLRIGIENENNRIIKLIEEAIKQPV